MPGTHEKLTMGDDVREYTDFSSDIDLTDATAGSPCARAPRLIEVLDVGSGTLAVVPVGSRGVTRTLTATAISAESRSLKTACQTIKSTTDVGRVRVTW